VDVVRPGLGEILPGMCGRVRADEGMPPIGGSARVVMPLQSLAVILGLIPKSRR
jgi:hypothetical protein